MPSLKALGIIGTGGLGVLVAGLLISSALKTGWDPLFAVLLFIFVLAGAIALVARNL
jgi:Co/Zn/Cd efflux system component